jgi:hypothetical protein
MTTHYRAPTCRRRACPKQTQRPYSQSGTLSTSACSRSFSSLFNHSHCDWTATSGTPPKTHRRTPRSHSVASLPPLSCFLGSDSAHAGAFFAELADALAAPTFAHRLALYVGHDGSLVRLLAGLGAVPLRWPAFGAEVVFEVRLPVQYPICFDMYESIRPRCGRMSVCASYACSMRARYSAGWNGCSWTSLWAG